MKLDLHQYMTLNPEMIKRLYSDGMVSAEAWILPERSGLRKRVKACSTAEWATHKETLSTWEMLGEGQEAQLNVTEACKVRNWLGVNHYSMATLLKMQMSWDPLLTLPRPVRWALQVYEELIRKSGEVKNSSGHTVLPRVALLMQLATKCPLGYMAHLERGPEDDDGIGYTITSAGELLDALVTEGLLAELAKDGDPHWGVYVPEYLEVEREFVAALQKPSTPLEIDVEKLDDLIETASLDSDQRKALIALLTSEHTGHGLIGYPGGGKTYLTAQYARYVGAQNVLALATTGAAALVLARQLPSLVQCSTISSAYCNLGNKAWDHRFDRSILVVDECSMLNIQFLHQLVAVIDRVQPRRIIITGDPNQLPPVGAGAIFSALVQGDLGVAGSRLSGQHRMSPEALAYLMPLVETQTWGQALNSTGKSLVLGQNTEHHSIHRMYANAILAQVTDWVPTLAAGALDATKRVIISTYTSTYGNIINTLVEATRLGVNTSRFHEAVKTFVGACTASRLAVTGRVRKVSEWQQRKYVGAFLTKGLTRPSKSYNDEIATTEANVESAYNDLLSYVKANQLAPGAFVRCRKNLWFSLWSGRRRDFEANKYGISGYGDMANGQLYTVMTDGTLFCAETGASVEIRDAEKASKLFKLAWCSTTHKLQGDSAHCSIYLHSNTNAENRLVYVAMSRGRNSNICIINHDNAMGWQDEYDGSISTTLSVERLSVYAELIRSNSKAVEVA